MQDRLGELRADLEPVEQEDQEKIDLEGGTVDLPNGEVQDEFMKDFFEEVNSIKAGMGVIKKKEHQSY